MPETTPPEPKVTPDVLEQVEEAVEGSWEAVLAEARAHAPWDPVRVAAEMVKRIRHEEGVE